MIYSVLRGWWKKQKLRNATDKVPPFCLDGYKGWAKIVNVYDGDTFRACIYKNNRLMKFTFRPIGYDAPEMRPRLDTPNREKHIEQAKEARTHFIQLVNYKDPPNNPPRNISCFTICDCEESYDSFVYIDCKKNDKYGRTLVTLYKKPGDEISINSQMLSSSLVLPYEGKTKKEFNFV